MVEDVLRSVRRGEMGVREAARLLRSGHLPAGSHARFDISRTSRTGLPEIVLGEGKSVEHLERILASLRAAGIGAIVSRLTPAQLRRVAELEREGWPLTLALPARMAALLPGRIARPLRGRTAALLSAGTADAQVAEEIRFVLEQLGAEVLVAFDVGVAGLHRLARVLPAIVHGDPGVYVVCAGREGALATVVAGLVDRPVVGVPTSQGYGRGGRGEGALTSMLQSCAPLAVVNIDAGVPAALVAAQILRSRGSGGGRPPGKLGSRRGRPRRRR
jgi:pyridinium-3,5-biscarboxylic acid mononucleotide synthase